MQNGALKKMGLHSLVSIIFIPPPPLSPPPPKSMRALARGAARSSVSASHAVARPRRRSDVKCIAVDDVARTSSCELAAKRNL